MYLKRITLKNFRCFESIDIDLHPQLTVLVGVNGAGKTAILDGIAIGLAPILSQLSSANQRLSTKGAKILDTDFRLVPLGKRRGNERWGASDYAQVIVETTDGLRWDEWRAATKNKRISPSDRVGKKALESRLSEIEESFIQSNRELLPICAYYGAQRGRIEEPQRLRENKNNYDHPTSALIDALNPLTDFRQMLAWFDGEEAAELRRNKGLDPEQWTTSIALDAVREAIRLLLSEEFGNPYFNDQHRFVVESNADGRPFRVKQLSQGYQSMLALAMDFARRLAIGNDHLDLIENEEAVEGLLERLNALGRSVDGSDTGVATKFAPAVMLVDEIDLHLHPSWQQRVLADLMRAFPGTQFIVTTHSPQVLTTVSNENIRVLREIDGQLVANKPAFSPLAHESGDALAKIMETQREPDLDLQGDIRMYELLVRSGDEGSAEAIRLRAKLEDAGYQFHESDLTTWRFLAGRKTKIL
ncbi:MAG: AAA family ATPase [Dokdonella sp.]|nr:AAA family ATPase [Dokdonella sp.]